MKEKKSVKTFMIAIILLFQITIIIASGNAKNYSHPQSTLAVDTLNMKVMVPAYFSSSALWARMATQSAKMPGRIYAIANLNNGPGTSVSSTYTTFINNMHTNFGKVIGYVWTSYGNIPLATAEADIDKWFSFYPTLDGIFFDGQSNTTGKETYYQTLYNYVKSKNAAGLVVANPGINTISNYLVYNGNRVSDVVCIFEAATGFDTWSPSSWTAGYSSDNFYVLPYNTTSSQWVSRLNRAISKNIGWIYLTDDTGANPWDILPTYFEAYCDYIINNPTIVEENGTTIPKEFILSQNYPNPFNPSTTINYTVPKTSFVTIKVYDVLGRVVTTIVNENKPAGNFSVEFNASNLVSGIYFYRMESGSYTQTKKLLLLK